MWYETCVTFRQYDQELYKYYEKDFSKLSKEEFKGFSEHDFPLKSLDPSTIIPPPVSPPSSAQSSQRVKEACLTPRSVKIVTVDDISPKQRLKTDPTVKKVKAKVKKVTFVDQFHNISKVECENIAYQNSYSEKDDSQHDFNELQEDLTNLEKEDSNHKITKVIEEHKEPFDPYRITYHDETGIPKVVEYRRPETKTVRRAIKAFNGDLVYRDFVERVHPLPTPVYDLPDHLIPQWCKCNTREDHWVTPRYRIGRPFRQLNYYEVEYLTINRYFMDPYERYQLGGFLNIEPTEYKELEEKDPWGYVSFCVYKTPNHPNGEKWEKLEQWEKQYILDYGYFEKPTHWEKDNK